MLNMHKLITLLLALFVLLICTNQPALAETAFLFWGNGNKYKLQDSWNWYKNKYISPDGRVIDYERDNITTSEGQAYAMRRALMMNDQATFDKVYDWAKKNLQHKNDSLFAWKWGKSGGEYQVLDDNSATDADIEIAATLLSAYRNWHIRHYLDEARPIISDIWDKETVEINGQRVLTAGDVQAKDEKVIEVNPSYFMPHTFRLFARADRKHDWKKVVDSSYKLVDYCIDNIESGLPPDWFYMDRKTGEISFKPDKSDFSYDAIRVFYRFYLDYKFNKDSRAKKILSRAHIFIDDWERNNKIRTEYKQNGDPKSNTEFIGSISVLVPVIKMQNKKIAEQIYRQRVKNQYNKAGYWGDPMNYYAQNLVWFGDWLYLDGKNLKAFKY